MRLGRRETPLADAMIGGVGGPGANDGNPFPGYGGVGGGIFADGGFAAYIGNGGSRAPLAAFTGSGGPGDITGNSSSTSK